MGHTNQTTNLHLPQFIGSDKPTWLSDVNGAMLAIDNAYGQIAADASAAQTAASGAVTTATSAASTASSAASTASTAASNASTALSTANNAASTANNAYNEAHEALGRVNGQVVRSITGDGVKTFSEVLTELVLSDSELTHNSMILFEIGGAKSEYKIVSHSSSSAVFMRSQIQGNGHFKADGFRVTYGSAGYYLSVTLNADGTVTETNSSSDPVTSGAVATLYK